eukprot:TRINITY_DN2949_c0_g2_i1.p1 TRINITY_DN2949_c0_g2~~TRINITY_DN2949_c0_g2_i1.p1  ORF type:complete len:3309 (-),score=891.59 TRINITY_DN2949_c0_g2_i1:55-9981(-)
MKTEISRSLTTLAHLLDQIPAAAPPHGVAKQIQQEIKDFAIHLPLITALRTTGMRERHWRDVESTTGIKLVLEDDTSFADILKAHDFAPHIEQLQAISNIASQEYVVEHKLDQMQHEWTEVAFTLQSYKNTGTFILNDPTEIARLAEDQIIAVQGMRNSKIVLPFELQDRIAKWEARLLRTSDVLDEWLRCQRSYMYLEPIFSNDDIVNTLSMDARKFADTDRKWRDIMAMVERNPRVMNIMSGPRILQSFVDSNAILDGILKRFTEYMDTRRAVFPRAYFLSNREMLQLMSQGEDTVSLQHHIPKLFPGVHFLEFQQKPFAATAMVSAAGERLTIGNPVAVVGTVDTWLVQLESEMKVTLRTQLEQAIVTFPGEVTLEWMQRFPAQIVAVAESVLWCREVELALAQGGSTFLQKVKIRIAAILDLLFKAVTDPHVSKNMRRTLEHMSGTMLTHRDVLHQLRHAVVSDVRNLQWQKQFRYFWDADTRSVVLRHLHITLPYGYEYCGTPPLLAPNLHNTDTVYPVLAQAVSMQLGSCLAGPEDAGKRETIRAFALMSARPFIAFNCNARMPYASFAKLLKGIAATGAWVCLASIDRVAQDVLSTLTELIAALQRAVAAQLKRFRFSQRDTEVALNSSLALFVTISPRREGRSALPDNLRMQLRVVQIIPPDAYAVTELLMQMLGIPNDNGLLRRMVALHSLAHDRLLPFTHYRLGLRSLCSIVHRIATYLRGPEGADMTADRAAVRSFSDLVLPRLTTEDANELLSLMATTFPDEKLDPPGSKRLTDAIVKAIKDAGLEVTTSLIESATQLYDAVLYRRGTFLLGDVDTGKTTCYRTLARAVNLLAKQQPNAYPEIDTILLNPSALSMMELYGEFDNNNLKDWREGILVEILNQAHVHRHHLDMVPQVQVASIRDGSTPVHRRTWIVLDSAAWRVWTATLDSALHMEDDAVLCLANSERIRLPRSVRFLFEVDDVAHASPSTVSRCAFVYMRQALPWQTLVSTWCTRLLPTYPFLQESNVEHVVQVCGMLLASSLQFVRNHFTLPLNSSDVHLVRNYLNMMDCLLQQYTKTRPVIAGHGAMQQANRLLESMMAFAVVWSIGSCIENESRSAFDTFMRNLLKIADTAVVFPSEKTVFDYRLELPKDEFVLWDQGVAPLAIPHENMPFYDYIVPTAEHMRLQHLLTLLSSRCIPVLLHGPPASGKTLAVSRWLRDLPNETHFAHVARFSAMTTSVGVRNMIKFERRRKNIFGAAIGQTMVVFVDDMHLPVRNRDNDLSNNMESPFELLRQWVGHGGWYDTRSRAFQQLTNVHFVATMTVHKAERCRVTPRLLKLYHYLHQDNIASEDVRSIFTTIVDTYFQHVGSQADMFRAHVTASISAAAEALRAATYRLPPTPKASHYLFSILDISRVAQGLCLGVSGLKDAQAFVNLWTHEMRRTFKDRLASEDDRTWFEGLLQHLSRKNFPAVPPCENDVLFADVESWTSNQPSGQGYIELEDLHPVLESLDSRRRVISTSGQYLMKHSLHKLAAFGRVLATKPGHLLMLGDRWSIHQVTDMALSVMKYRFVEMSVSESITEMDWTARMKEVLLSAGIEDTPTVFIFERTEFVLDRHWEDLSAMMSVVEFTGLWTPEEIENIHNAVKPIARRLGVRTSPQALYSLFLDRVRANLHIIIIMGRADADFRRLVRMFPAVLRGCTVDWYGGWRDDELFDYAERALAGVAINQVPLTNVCAGFAAVYHVAQRYADKIKEVGRYAYIGCESFVHFIDNFAYYTHQQQTKIAEQSRLVNDALDMLLRTHKHIDSMEEEATEQRPLALASQKQADALMEAIEKEKAQAGEQRNTYMRMKDEMEVHAAELHKRIDDTERELKEADPALIAATENLKTLQKAEMFHYRSAASLPNIVSTLIEIICLMKSIAFTPEAVRQILSETKLVKTLQAMQPSTWAPVIWQRLEAFVRKFTKAEGMKKGMKAVFQWLHALVRLQNAKHNFEPHRAEIEQWRAEITQSQVSLDIAKMTLDKMDEHVQQLRDEHRIVTDKTRDIKAKIVLANKRAEAARALTSELLTNKSQWLEEAKQLKQRHMRLIGNMMLVCATITSSGLLRAEHRLQFMADCGAALDKYQLPHNAEFALTDFVDTATHFAGSVCLDVVTSDALVLTVGSVASVPLLIDPEEIAVELIHLYEKHNDLTILQAPSASDSTVEIDVLSSCIDCVRSGKPLVLVDIQHKLHPMLAQLLDAHRVILGRQVPKIQLGESKIDVHPNFRLYLTTSEREPVLVDSQRIKMTVIDFVPTSAGINARLNDMVLLAKNPMLFEDLSKAVQHQHQQQRSLAAASNKLLTLLSQAEPAAVDDAFNKTVRETRDAVETVLKEMSTTERRFAILDDQAEKYRLIAQKATPLFMAMCNVGKLHDSYQFSLQWFCEMLKTAYKKIKVAEIDNKAIDQLNTVFAKTLYTRALPGLQQRHRIVLGLQLSIAALQSQGQASDAEIELFLKLGDADPFRDEHLSEPIPPNPASEWMQFSVWVSLVHLAQLPAFKKLDSDVAGATDHWRSFCHSSNPFEATIPGWSARLNTFQKFVLYSCVFPSKQTEAITWLVQQALAIRLNDAASVMLEGIYNDSKNKTPILLTTAHGANVLQELQLLAQRKGSRKVTYIALGPERLEAAEKLIAQSMDSPQWLLVENCHLVPQWLPRLYKLVRSMETRPVQSDFRLWLTTAAAESFLPALASRCLKMSIESPDSLRSTLYQLYTKSASYIDKLRTPEYRSAIGRALLFHALLMQRERYGALAYEQSYGISDFDLYALLEQLVAAWIAGENSLDAESFAFIAMVCYRSSMVTHNDAECAKYLAHNLFVKAVAHLAKWQPKTHTGGLLSYQDWAVMLPAVTPFAALSLDKRASVIASELQLKRLMTCLRSVLRADMLSVTGHGRSRKQLEEDALAVVDELAVVVVAWTPIPMPDQSHEDPLAGVARREAMRHNAVTKVVQQNVDDLQRALKGTGPLSTGLGDLSRFLASNTVPPAWHESKDAPSAQSVKVWLAAFTTRHTFLEEWASFYVNSAASATATPAAAPSPMHSTARAPTAQQSPLAKKTSTLAMAASTPTGKIPIAASPAKGTPVNAASAMMQRHAGGGGMLSHRRSIMRYLNAPMLPQFKPPTVFELEMLWKPRSVVSSITLRFALKKGIPLEKVAVRWQPVLESEIQDPDPMGGCYFIGLHIKGATWNSASRSLEEAPDDVVFSKLPPLHMWPVRDADRAAQTGLKCNIYRTVPKYEPASHYRRPLKPLLTIKLQATKHQLEQWSSRGTLIACQTVDNDSLVPQ